MADFDVKQLAVDLLSELKALSGIGNSAGGDDGKSGQKYKGDPAVVDLKIFKDAAELLAHKLDGLAQQIGINTTALKAIPGAYIGLQSTDDTSKAFSNAINLLGKDIAKFASKLEEQRLQAAAGLNAGIGQGNFLTQRAEFQKAGFKNFEDGLKGVTDATGNFKSSLAGLGHSADDSTRKFNKFAEGLGNTEAIQTLIKRNVIQPTDVPKLALLAAQGKTSALDTPESRAKLIAEMGREAQIISQMSIAYGINKQALMDNAIAINDTSEAQIRQGALADDNARRAMRTAQTLSIPSGKSMAELVGKLSSGARLSKEDRAMLSVGTMGLGGQLTSAVKEIQRTKNLAPDDAQRLAAEDRFLDVQAQIRSRLLGVEGQRLAQSMKEGPERAALEKMITEARAAALTEAKIQKELGVSSREAARVAQIRLGGAAFRGEEQNVSGAATPTANTGAKVSETLAEANLAYGKNATAVSDIVAELNIQLGTAAKGFKAVKDALTGELGPGDANESVAEKKKRLAPLANAIEGVVSNPNTISEDLNKRLGTDPTGKRLPATTTPPATSTQPVNVVTPTVNITSPNVTVTGVTPAQPPAQPPVTTPAVQPPVTTPAVQPAAPPANRLNPDGTIKPATETRGTGTLGETGFPAEMKDVVAKLHKGETVLTPEQMKNLISGTGMMSASDTASAMLASMTGNKGDSQTGGIDITKIFDSVSTNISSASKPELITSDIIYTGTLKALKEINGVTFLEPVKSDSKTSLTVPAIPPVNVVVPDMPAVKVAIPEVKAPVIPDVKVAIPEVKAPVIPDVKVAIPEVKAPVITPVNVATPKPLTPAASTNKTDSIIDKQLAKFGIDIGNLSGKLPSNIPTSVTTTSASISEIQKYMSQGMSQADAQKKATKTTFETVPTFIPDSGIKKIFDSVSTTISSVTGGGSTTTKRVQSDDSKSAEKELSSAKEQFQIEKQALREKIKEQLGPNASRSDITKAAMSSDEGSTIFKQYNEKFTALSKQIDAGISYQTNFESGIQRGNIVERSTTSVPITDAVKGFEPTPTENQKEERAEEPQTIDLDDSEPKTKDLHDQLIQLNSSIRQLVEHSASGVDLAGAQIKATRGLSGNRFA